MKTDSQGESMLFGVSFRSWLAAAIIVPGVLTICYLTILTKDMTALLGILGTVMGFLYGTKTGFKAGVASSEEKPPPNGGFPLPNPSDGA